MGSILINKIQATAFQSFSYSQNIILLENTGINWNKLIVICDLEKKKKKGVLGVPWWLSKLKI